MTRRTDRFDESRQMSFPLSYCPQGATVLQRLRRLYQRRSQEIVLAAMAVPSRELAAFAERHRPGRQEYPEPSERVQFWDALLKERTALYDDSIPTAYLSEMDQGLYGGLIGGEVRFLCDPASGWISSMVPPILRDWSEFEQLSFSTEHEWFHRYRRQLDVFTQAARGKFAISHFILISGLNFVFELVGATQTYFDLIDRPEMVRRAIDLGFELNVKVQETFFENTPLLEGGTCSNMAQWVPGRIVSESVDPFHMTSIDYFQRWGRENLERIFERFDGGVLHLHGNGRHLLETVASVRGLKAVFLVDEDGYPPVFAELEQYKRRVGDLPLVASVDYWSFSQALKEHRLTGGVFYRVGGVPDLDTANRCMDLVREYDA